MKVTKISKINRYADECIKIYKKEMSLIKAVKKIFYLTEKARNPLPLGRGSSHRSNEKNEKGKKIDYFC